MRGGVTRKIQGEFHDAHLEPHTAAILLPLSQIPCRISILHQPWPLKSAHIPEEGRGFRWCAGLKAGAIAFDVKEPLWQVVKSMNN